jgi:hypothetical protein
MMIETIQETENYISSFASFEKAGANDLPGSTNWALRHGQLCAAGLPATMRMAFTSIVLNNGSHSSS